MDIKELAKIMKALSNENRLELFIEILKKQETCFETEDHECFITDIMKSMNIGAPTVSHHIKELTNAGLVITERKGKFLSARINNETMQEAINLFQLKS
ncbi:MAG: winged helix-turn-helix transcriptional regulator [Spirochaetes bacterium]|nr:winged helix-turn-helix transcriptional regulator [Spirochaetota bacterium]